MDETSSPTSGLVHVDAPHRELLDQILDKWSLQVIDVLCGNPMRFNELRREIPSIGQKSLTSTLRRLERNGMVERVVLRTRPIAVEYRTAAVGDSLNELIESLLRWTTENLPEVESARERFDATVRDPSDEGV